MHVIAHLYCRAVLWRGPTSNITEARISVCEALVEKTVSSGSAAVITVATGLLARGLGVARRYKPQHGKQESCELHFEPPLPERAPSRSTVGCIQLGNSFLLYRT